MRYFAASKWSIGAIALALCGLICMTPAQAGALLKPVGKASEDLQPRAIDVQAQIDGAWAHTSVTTVYANANTQPIEADFIYAAPPGAVITGFAYWYGREKVVAQVTEKERAHAIYALAKSANNDPALVEMEGKNVFRARIAQVLPKYNLRVEIKFAQPLAFSKGVPTWSYPLLDDTRDVTLDWLRVRASMRNAPQAKNNFGADLEDGQFVYRKYNYKPSFDPRIAMTPKASEAALQANLVVQHRKVGDKTNEDGYFALSIHGKGLKGSPKLNGVDTYDVLPAERGADGEVHLFGRYRGKGAATVTWGQEKTVVQFPPASEAENEVEGLAAPLWGANKIAAIQDEPNTRGQVMALSMAFAVPSKWTSWVAMPREQRIAMRQQLRKLDMERKGADLSRTFVLELENGRPFSPRALKARADLRALARSGIGRQSGFNEEKSRSEAIEKRMAELGREAMAARMGLKKKQGEDARLTRLANVAGTDKTPFLVRAQKNLRDIQVKTVAQKWTQEVVSLRENTPAAKKLKVKLATLQERYGMDDEDYVSAAYQKTAEQMARLTLNEALAGRENGIKAAVYIDAGERYARKCGQDSFQQTFYQPAIQSSLEETSDEILHEIQAGRDASRDAIEAKNRVQALYALAPELKGDFHTEGSKEWEIDRARRGLAHEVAYRIAQSKAEHPDQKAEIWALEAQLDRLADQTEADADDILKAETQRYKNKEPLLNARQFTQQEEGAVDDPTPIPAPVVESTEVPTPEPADEPSAPDAPSQYQVRPGDPLISLAAPRDARQVVAILPDGAVKKLEWNEVTSRWETRFDVPAYAPDGGYFVQILLVRRDGSRAKFQMRFDVDTVAPKAHGAALNGGAKWNLRLWTEGATERVSALTPWKARVELKRQKDGLWAQGVTVPTAWQGRKAKVLFFVTDSAHNRTEIALDWN